MTRYLRVGALAGAAAILASAIGMGAVVAQDEVEFDVYDLHTVNPGLAFTQMAADAFMGLHPGVKINVVTLENEALKDRISADMAAGSPPDVFQSWGSGVLRQQVDAGMVQDITDAVADIKDEISPGAMSLYQLDGRQYGIPYNFGLVGLWYNSDLLAEAGIEAPATTWQEFLDQVQILKDAGITPISIGAGDQWPAMFWWAYLATRIGGQEALDNAIATGDWTGEAFVRAGEELKRLVDMDPFQPGALAATHDEQQGVFGNGEAAYMLQGQWAIGSQRAQSASGQGIGNALGWAQFPTVEGGAGLLTDVFGGGDGYSIGRDAPPEAVEFVKYLVSPDVASVWQSFNDGTLLPTNGAEQYITDPILAEVVQKRNEATFAQLYLDQATSPELGGAINAAVADLIAGVKSPEEVAQTITEEAALAAG